MQNVVDNNKRVAMVQFQFPKSPKMTVTHSRGVELLSLIQKFNSIGPTECEEELVFPPDDRKMTNMIGLKFTYKSAITAEVARNSLDGTLAWGKPIKVTLYHEDELKSDASVSVSVTSDESSEADLDKDFDREKGATGYEKISKTPKKWRAHLAKAEALEVAGSLDSAVEMYKLCYQHSLVHGYDKVASEAAAGLASVYLRRGELQRATDEIVWTLNEDIRVQEVSYKLVEKLVLIQLLSGKVTASAFTSLYGMTTFTKNQAPFQAFVVYIQSMYPAAMANLKTFLSSNLEAREAKLAERNLNDVIKLSAKIEETSMIEPESIINGQKYYFRHGKLRPPGENDKTDNKDKRKPKAETTENSGDNVKNEQAKSDSKKEQRQQPPPPQAKSSKKEKTPPPPQDNKPSMPANIEGKIGNAVRAMRSGKAGVAAKNISEALEVLDKSDDESRIILLYAQAMALLYSKALDNVKDGLELLERLHNAHSDAWFKKNFPAVFFALASYKEIMRQPYSSKYFDRYENSSLKNINPHPVSDILSEVFPGLKNLPVAMDDLQWIWQHPPTPLATCRHEDCQSVHEKSERAKLLQWKATIHERDLDYKGFTRLSCTEKCDIDFHPWCWKNQKELDGTNTDKDYLSRWCLTPDCHSPISKIQIFQVDKKDPVVITDDDVTKKMTKSGRKKDLQRTGAKPKAKQVNGKANNSDLDPDEDPVERELRQLRTALANSKARERDLQKQLKTAEKERQENFSKLDDLRGQAKRVQEEHNRIKTIARDEKQQTYAVLEGRQQIESLSQKLQNEENRHVFELRDLKIKNGKIKLKSWYYFRLNLISVSDLDASNIIADETQKLTNLIAFANEHLLPQSEVLPRYLGNLANRIEEADKIKRLILNGQHQRVDFRSLYSIPVELDFDKLLREVTREKDRQERGVGGSVEVSDTASTASSSDSGAKGNKLQVVIDSVKEVYPDCTHEEILQHISLLKERNSGTLKGLTINNILDHISNWRETMSK